MRRILSIALVVIMLLNTMGYYGFFLGAEFHNDVVMSRELDAGIYDQSNAITIKMAFSIPYLSDQIDFENAEGQFEYGGELYRMVKRKYAGDTLTLICVKDVGQKKINLALTEFVKTFTDTAPDGQSSSKAGTTFIKDFIPSMFSITFATQGWSLSVTHVSAYHSLSSTFLVAISQPPEIS